MSVSGNVLFIWIPDFVTQQIFIDNALQVGDIKVNKVWLLPPKLAHSLLEKKSQNQLILIHIFKRVAISPFSSFIPSVMCVALGAKQTLNTC